MENGREHVHIYGRKRDPHAADDAIRQLKDTAALALRCSAEDIEIGNETAYLREDPSISLKFKDIVYGVMVPDGNALGGPVVGRGKFIMKPLSTMAREPAKGDTGPDWTPGAPAVDGAYDKNEHTFRLVRAVTVLDAGKCDPSGCAIGQVKGAMNTGLGLATREIYHYSQTGELQDTSLRTYKLMHFAEKPRLYRRVYRNAELKRPVRGTGTRRTRASWHAARPGKRPVQSGRRSARHAAHHL